MPPTAADVSGLLRVLSEHDVDFVVVGGGLSILVLDLDVLIDVKREVASEKDLATLPVLVRTLEARRTRDASAILRDPNGH